MWQDIAVVVCEKIFQENEADEIDVFDLKVWITFTLPLKLSWRIT